MFAIVGDVIACVFWGFLISLTLTLLFFCAIKLFYPTYSYSIVSGVLLAVLAIFLFIQSFLLMGANYVKDYTGGIGNLALTVIGETENTIRLMSADINPVTNAVEGQVDINAIKSAIVAEYPVVSKYIEGWENLQGIAADATPTQIASAIVDGVNGEINAYIGRRVFWMLGAMMLAIIGFCLLIAPGVHTSRAYSSRETRRTIRATGRRRSHSSSRYR